MNKIIVVLVAVIVIVAGASVAIFVLNGNDKKIEIPDVAEGTGTVYGNSDGNCYIDEVDVAIAESIIAGERTLADFPFADADCSGSVTEKDVALIKDMVAKKDMKVKVLDTQGKVVNVQYPIKNLIVLCGSNLAPLMNILDVTDLMVGAAYSTLDPIRDYPVDQAIANGSVTKISTNGTAADMTLISRLNADVMLTEYSSMYDLDSDTNIAILNDYGIDVLCMECRDPGDDMRSLAVFGILLDRGDNVVDYMDFCDQVYKEIEKIEGNSKGTTTVILSALASSLTGITSGYNKMLEMAGGKNLADWTENSKSVAVGDTWIYESKYASDCLLLGATSNYGGSGFTAASIASYEEKYKNHHAWTDGDVYIYSTGIPVVIRVAYYAEAMYPELFEEGWAIKWHQKLVDQYFGADFTVPVDMFCKKIN